MDAVFKQFGVLPWIGTLLTNYGQLIRIASLKFTHTIFHVFADADLHGSWRLYSVDEYLTHADNDTDTTAERQYLIINI